MQAKSNEYTTYPLQFETFKWYKPILVAALTAVFTAISQGILTMICILWIGKKGITSGEAIDKSGPYFFSGPGALAAIGGVAIMLLALAIAVRIVRDRPFSSYSSSRGGWSWAIFFRSILIALIMFCCLNILTMFLTGGIEKDGVNRFTVIGFLICTILIPLQAVAEEYVFRGLLMQTIGAWSKLPALAILLSSIIFAITHSYGLLGIIAVFFDGLMFAMAAWYTKGLEASSAAHIINNMTLLYCMGLGLGSAQEGGLGDLIAGIAINVLYIAALVLLDKKFGWFSKNDH